MDSIDEEEIEENIKRLNLDFEQTNNEVTELRKKLRAIPISEARAIKQQIIAKRQEREDIGAEIRTWVEKRRQNLVKHMQILGEMQAKKLEEIKQEYFKL